MNGNNIQAALIEIARKLMQKMADKVNQNDLPTAINKATYASQVTNSGNTYRISVLIDLSENGAPMAAAFEYGSGIWGSKGQRYKIAPKNGKWLVFEYGVGRNVPSDIPGLAAKPVWYLKGSDTAIFKYVMHPGVQAKPYIEPSIIENRADAKRLLAKAFVESLTVRGTTKYEVRVM